MTNPSSLTPSWTLALGPGSRTALLGTILRPLVGGAADADLGLPRLEDWGDLDRLLGAASNRGRLVLDSAQLPRDDMGLVRRFLERRTGWEILLLDSDTPQGHHASLLNSRRVNFAPWPMPVDGLHTLLERPPTDLDSRPLSQKLEEDGLDLEGQDWTDQEEPDLDEGQDLNFGELGELGELDPPVDGSTVDGSNPRARAQLREIETILHPQAPPAGKGLHPADWLPSQAQDLPASSSHKTRPRATASLLDEALSIGLSRDEIDAFHALDSAFDEDLEGVEDPADSAPLDSLGEGSELADFALPDELASRQEPVPSAATNDVLQAPASHEPPSWYRSQIADLADIAQRLQLDSLALREAGGAAAGAADIYLALEQDVQRLGQFARTLGFVAAPPPPGQQSLDLGGFLQELLASALSTGDENAPRVLFRCPDPLPIRADKALLGAALDAMAQLAIHCMGAGEHAGELRVRGEIQAGEAVLDMEFQAGPLAPASAVPPGSERPRPGLLEPYALRRTFPEFGANALAAARGILVGQDGNLSIVDRPGGLLAVVARLPLAPTIPGDLRQDAEAQE